MNYQEFLTTIRTQLSLRIETGVTLDIRSFTKNNGTHYDGLVTSPSEEKRVTCDLSDAILSSLSGRGMP